MKIRKKHSTVAERKSRIGMGGAAAASKKESGSPRSDIQAFFRRHPEARKIRTKIAAEEAELEQRINTEKQLTHDFDFFLKKAPAPVGAFLRQFLRQWSNS